MSYPRLAAYNGREGWMMDDILNGGMPDFDAVWRRVTGQSGDKNDGPVCDRPAKPEKDPEDALLLLIHDETCAGAGAAGAAFFGATAVVEPSFATSRCRPAALPTATAVAAASAPSAC